MVKSLVSECSPGGNSFAMLSYIHPSLIITRIGSSWYLFRGDLWSVLGWIRATCGIAVIYRVAIEFVIAPRHDDSR